jgi:hypothetical protein
VTKEGDRLSSIVELGCRQKEMLQGLNIVEKGLDSPACGENETPQNSYSVGSTILAGPVADILRQ